MILNVLKVFGLSSFAFFLAIFLTPLFTHYFYKYKMWKKGSRSLEDTSEEFKKIHNEHGELNTPRIGGMIIWVSTLLVCLLMFAIYKIFPDDLTQKLNFLSKNQTWLPLFVLVGSAIVGLADDLLQIFQNKKGGKLFANGLSKSLRILVVLAIGAIVAMWFYYKLEMNFVDIPFFGELYLGWLFVPFFMMVMLGIFSGGIIDGIDGLSGGIMSSIFAAYAGIAFFQNQIDIATFCGVITGSLLAFLWFNIPPARFYMGETGMIGLTTALTVVAFLTNAVAVLPIIAFLLVAASASAIIQIVSKKYFHKKVFRVAPIHHHFEAIGWPSYKVTMRFWIISVVLAVIGMVITLIG
ncbi:MAG: Phospho-N-acetylmuramoyl-pentapeptide-transferase [Parcubacteria group bacterium Athens0714_24]|nr:MAG: Phospho-N-acetylmuramoyl-pentapeptide-transferase [Parcubacteria group bacterium Athens0714_24]